MKKKMAIFMAVVCLMCLSGGMVVRAQEYFYCPYCGAGDLRMTTQHLGDWNNQRVFEERGGTGKTITCYEHYSMDRTVKYCPNGCGIVWEGEPVETSTHSVEQCPYNK